MAPIIITKSKNFLLLLIITTIVVIEYGQSNNDHINNEQNKSSRFTLAIPKMFNFYKFKQLFNKKYDSLREELVRERIFLARAFRAFISVVAFKHKKLSFCMKINENSDWTKEEIRSIEVRETFSQFSKGNVLNWNDDMMDETNDNIDNGKSFNEPQPIADMDDIVKQINIIDKNKDQQGYKEIANELELKLNAQSKATTLDVVDTSQYDDDNNNNKNHNTKLEKNEEVGEDKHNTGFLATTTVGKLVYKFVNLFSSSQNKQNIIKTESLRTEDGGETNNSVNSNDNKTYILHIDHRNCLPPKVKHQSKCGSCYVHSTIALYEFIYCKEKGEVIRFSEQYCLDCGPRIESINNYKWKGCDGGTERICFDFINKYGLERLEAYPYRKRADVCPYDKFTGPRKMGYIKPNKVNFVELKWEQLEQHVREGPVLIGLASSDLFQDYSYGIDDGSVCDKRRQHSVIIVGMGEENGVPFWLIRNSYGKSWGENGHYRLAKSAKHCILENGKGFVIKAANKENKVFGEKNESYDIGPIKKRYLDYKNGLLTMPNFKKTTTTLGNNESLATECTLMDDSATPSDDYDQET